MMRSPCKLGAKLGHHLSHKLLAYELLIMARAEDSVEFVRLTVVFDHHERVWRQKTKSQSFLFTPPPHRLPPAILLRSSLSFSFLFRILLYPFRSQGKLCGYQRRRCQLNFRRTGHDYIRQKKQQKMAFLSEKRPGSITNN